MSGQGSNSGRAPSNPPGSSPSPFPDSTPSSSAGLPRPPSQPRGSLGAPPSGSQTFTRPSAAAAARAGNFLQPFRPGGGGQGALRDATSSPLFFQSSPPATGQTPRGSGFVSSPLAYPSDDDPAATPRASHLNPPAQQNFGGSSPINYGSSSPGRPHNVRTPAFPGSSSSALFVRSDTVTPARNRRHDINSDVFSASGSRRRLFVDANGMAVPASDAATFSNLDPNTSDADAMAGNATSIIWGTNISVQDAMNAFKDFLRNFRPKYRHIKEGLMDASEQLPPEDPAMHKEYVEMMEMMLELGVAAMNLDARNLKAYPPTTKLWHQLHGFPNEIIPIMDQALKDEMIDLAERRMGEMRMQLQQRRNELSSDHGPMPDVPDLVRDAEVRVYKVRPFGLDATTNLRDLNPTDIDKLVSVKGMVIRATPVIPDMKDAFYKCAQCNHTVRIDIDRGKISEPTVCPREACKSPNSMQLIHNRSGFSDKQLIKLQETPDNVPAGQTPHSVSVCVYDELVDVCKAGDRVEITGIFKSSPVRVSQNERSVKNIFRTYVDGLHILKTDRRRMGADPSTIEEELADETGGHMEETRKISEEEIAKIEEVSRRPDVYELLARSLAPSIYEMDDVKKGILLQLFGGTNKSFDKGASPKYRGDINVLLCGDPSTSKSQMLQYVHKIAPRGIYTSGKGSSAVGLTAYVTRDPDTRQLVLESGALVLSDGGVCCIDEFDKMSDATRSVLHEVMEQQTVSIAKAGIITTLNARTSILASANPIGSRYNPNLSVPANIDLPPTLLSRFDLVYLVLDRTDEQMDRRLARHLVSMYLEDTPEHVNREEILPTEFLTAYISHARRTCHPRISPPAAQRLTESYVSMRSLGSEIRSTERRITATTRQLESMIRLSEAHAKMRLSETVEESDVDEAVRLIQSALKQSATDLKTGLIDMGLLSEGGSAAERERRDALMGKAIEVMDLLGSAGEPVRFTDLVKRLGEELSQESEDGVPVILDNAEVLDAVRTLENQGVVRVSGEGLRRTLRKVVR